MRRCGTGCVAVAVALALATPDRAMASPPSDDEIAQLYGEAQRRYEARDYMRAAESWTRLLNMLEASPENREIRESVILNVLDAHLEAYRHLVDEQGNKDILHLRRGEATLVDYYSSFVRVHGERVAMSRAGLANA